MRWIWIDRFVSFTSGEEAIAVKNVTLAEDHLHDYFPAYPTMPASLILEGMAQTAGLLVGEARQFSEKVILAKVGKAVFHCEVVPGDQLIHHAKIVSIDADAAAAEGIVTRKDQQGESQTVAEISLMFSHIDQNLAGKQFPKENFVFTDQFIQLVESLRGASSEGRRAKGER